MLPLVYQHLSYRDAIALGGSCKATRAVWQLPAVACFPSQQALDARFCKLYNKFWLSNEIPRNAVSLQDYHLLEAAEQLCRGLLRRTDTMYSPLDCYCCCCSPCSRRVLLQGQL